MTMRTLASPELEQMLYQSVVDDEFRAMLASDPTLFGVSDGLAWPAAVEPQDQTTLDVALAGVDAFQCRSTCSAGPFTVVCDGGTK